VTEYDNAGVAMCDLAYANLLHEKVRQLEAEEKRLGAFEPAPSVRFVPFIIAAQSSIQSVADRTDGK
jgi:hypothetical protein